MIGESNKRLPSVGSDGTGEPLRRIDLVLVAEGSLRTSSRPPSPRSGSACHVERTVRAGRDHSPVAAIRAVASKRTVSSPNRRPPGRAWAGWSRMRPRAGPCVRKTERRRSPTGFPAPFAADGLVGGLRDRAPDSSLSQEARSGREGYAGQPSVRRRPGDAGEASPPRCIWPAVSVAGQDRGRRAPCGFRPAVPSRLRRRGRRRGVPMGPADRGVELTSPVISPAASARACGPVSGTARCRPLPATDGSVDRLPRPVTPTADLFTGHQGVPATGFRPSASVDPGASAQHRDRRQRLPHRLLFVREIPSPPQRDHHGAADSALRRREP
ncbi:hypothetical protein SCANM63S_04427 [Streptomyces canarius]